jgi:hypothetical protein
LHSSSTLRSGIGVAAAVVALALALAPGAIAGKPGGGGTGSTGGTGGTISLVLIDSPDGLPHFGTHVTFNVSTSSTTQPWVRLQCYVGGTLVYDMSNGIFPTSLNEMFTLGPTPLWSSGASDCTATLENLTGGKRGSAQTLATTTFHVYA